MRIPRNNRFETAIVDGALEDTLFYADGPMGNLNILLFGWPIFNHVFGLVLFNPIHELNRSDVSKVILVPVQEGTFIYSQRIDSEERVLLIFHVADIYYGNTLSKSRTTTRSTGRVT